MKFTKLTDAYSGKIIYINIQNVISLQEMDSNSHPGSLHGSTTISWNGNMVTVKEHITEIIALLEGRDPRPAQILYGKSK